MNTDKLMELERKWRDSAAGAKRYSTTEYEDGFAAGENACADELAAALRAEQAVGDEQIARELLAEEYDKAGNWRSAVYLSRGISPGKNADIALRAIRRALGTARQSEGVVLEGVFAPRYVADGPEGMFGTDDLELAGKLIARGADDPDEWTVTDLTETGIEATKEAAAPGGEGEGKV